MIMKKIFDYVDQNFDRMMEEMKEFCSHRSVAGDKTGLEETRNWIDKKLSAVGIPHEFQKVENGNALISASVSGIKNRFFRIAGTNMVSPLFTFTVLSTS